MQRASRRAVEVVVACASLVLGAPLWLLIAALIKIESRGPVLYRSRRVGLLGESFTMLKYRTLFHGADAHADDATLRAQKWRGGDDPRATRVGRFLRRTGLDEVPQFVHVLRGEMAVVGPRPYVRDEVAALREKQTLRMQVKPGMTGLWQVSRREHLSAEEAIALDLQYVEHATLALDLRIMAVTPLRMLQGAL